MCYGGGGCLTEVDSCLVMFLGISGTFFGVGYGLFKLIEYFVC